MMCSEKTLNYDSDSIKKLHKTVNFVQQIINQRIL